MSKSQTIEKKEKINNQQEADEQKEKFHPHALEAEEIFKKLKTTKEGLSKEEVQKRLEKYGENKLNEGEKNSPFVLFLKQFKSALIYILLIAAGISYYYDHRIDTYVILGIIVGNSILGFLQEYRAEKSIEALNKLLVPKTNVLRDNEIIEIEASQLVPGDILLIEDGDKIPADARLIETQNFRTVESALTGESLPIHKTEKVQPEETLMADRKNMAWMGTFVAGGTATAVVVHTGMSTAFGKIASSLEGVDKSKGDFDKKTSILAFKMAGIAVFASFFIFFFGFFVRGFEFEEIFIFTIASLVSAIPEGLPAILTIVLALGARRMAARNAIIKKLPAIEDIGALNVIVTDKTGTLTQNTMTIQRIKMADGDLVNVTGSGWDPEGEIKKEDSTISLKGNKDLDKLAHIAALCNNARLLKRENKYEIMGDPTEAALVVFAEKAGLKKESTEKATPVITDFPFDNTLKYRASIVDASQRELYAVGAPEAILSKCNRYLENGEEKEMTDEKRGKYIEEIENMSRQALRVIALAYKETKEDREEIEDGMVHNLIYTGAVGMKDPARPEVYEAIQDAKKAGIRVVMATGDHKNTAVAIGKEIGLVMGEDAEKDESEIALTQQELEKMTDEEFAEAVKTINVFARLTPNMKLKIGGLLQEQGNLVAMTGDGVNDAPALKKVDVGISMGIAGTDVARESSEMVLADDNFASIVNAVEEGRTVFKNIRHASTFLVSTNFAESALIITTLAMKLPLPLLPTQILWLNLVTDGVSGAPLAAEPSHKDVLREPPRKRKENILSKEVIPFVLLMVFVMTVSTTLLFTMILPEGEDKARTAAFTVMAFCQLFNVLNMRALRHSISEIGWFSNKYVVMGLTASVLLQIAVIYTPFFQNIFNFVPLSFLEFAIAVLLASFVLIFGEMYKEFHKRFIQKHSSK